MEQVKPGAVVRLKSGGPEMTVSNVDTDLDTPRAYCDWFENTGSPYRIVSHYFPVTSLQVLTPG